MSDNTGGQFPAGWYPDQSTPGVQRWWDGVQWTPHTQPATVAAAAPALPTQPRNVPSGPPLPQAFVGPADQKPGNKTGWIVAGSLALVLLLVVMGSIIGSIARGVSDADLAAGSAPQASSEAPTPQPTQDIATPAPTPVEEVAVPAPVPTEKADTVNAEYFRTTAAGDIADLTKDLDDMLVAVDEAGVFRILGNSVEISFNYGQLTATTPPASVATEWVAALVVLEQKITVMDDAIEADNYDSIRAGVAGIRAQLAVMSGIIPRAV